MAEAKKILVVDDEYKIIEVVRSYLEHSGYMVYDALNGNQAVEMFEKINPSLIILDLMLPDISGEELCKTFRKKSRVPIIMLTAKINEENILDGFNIGADDYVTKPFSPKQLVARVTAMLRRTEGDGGLLTNVVSFNSNDLVIDTVRYEVRKNGSIVNLTPNEYKVLITLVKHPKKTFTREELVNIALRDDYDGYDRVIDTHVKNIRQKIETNPKEPKYIITAYGIGYKFGGE